MNNKKKRVVIYTAIFGKKDSLVDPLEVNPDCDYICFTDENIKSKVYKIIKLDNFFGTPRMDAKYFKVMPHLVLSEYEMTIWVDGSVVIKKDPVNYFKKMLLLCKICLFRHSLRDCVYDEAEICRISGLDSADRINNQVEFYRSSHYPENNGLYESEVMARLNRDSEVVNINTDWWNQIRKYSSRDQISLPFVLWKNEVTPFLVLGTVYSNDFFEVRKHQAP